MHTSIRSMNYTMREMEMAQEDPHYMERVAALAADQRSHYWFVERKSKDGKKWLFVRDLMASKGDAAEYFVKYLRGQEPKFRLTHQLSY